LECGHIEKAVYIGRESVADIRPPSLVSGAGVDPKEHACCCHHIYHARHPIVHLFTPEAYWGHSQSGTLGPATAKPNARCTLCTPSLGHLVHRVDTA
jgi:hypothetical protein